MENDAGATGDEAEGATVRASGKTGRVRLTEEVRYPDQSTVPYPQEDSWSLQAIVLGIVALLIIIASLFLILWGSFQS